MPDQCRWCEETDQTRLLLPKWVHHALDCGFVLLCAQCDEERIAKSLGRQAECSRCQESA